MEWGYYTGVFQSLSIENFPIGRSFSQKSAPLHTGRKAPRKKQTVNCDGYCEFAEHGGNRMVFLPADTWVRPYGKCQAWEEMV